MPCGDAKASRVLCLVYAENSIVDLDALPDEPAARLAAYQRSRARDEERELVAGIEAKMVAGEELTEQEEVSYGYSEFGTGASCPSR